MKYIYAYKTSDGTRHEAEMRAESREAVFVALRERGIKAIKVVAADGSKANGEVRGVRKRIVIVAVLCVAVVTGVLAFVLGRNSELAEVEVVVTPQGPVKVYAAIPLSRRAISGDRQRIEASSDVFKFKAESFLARFAEPGRGYSADEIDWPKQSDFVASFKTTIRYAENEFTEQIMLKRIVEGMKREMMAYLRGGGLVSGYIRELSNRQNIEISHREKAVARMKELLEKFDTGGGKNAKVVYEYWLKANAQLQSIGVYTLPMPEQLRNYQLSVDLND